VLLITESHDANAKLAGFISHRFGLDYAAVCVREKSGWAAFGAGSLEADLSDRELDAAFADRQDPARPADAAALGEIERVIAVGRQRGHLVPLRLGTRPIGALVVVGRSIESGTLETIAGVAAIAIERAQFLDERKSAELARQSEAVKSALLASFGHDLKTPLTAIRVAASNLQASWPDEQQRQEQSDLILAEVDRLTRLFQNVLEMARIDAGAVTQEMRWVAPTEIVEAARDRVEHALRGHVIEIAPGPERMVRLDPRLTAAALSHLLENAAHYSPGGTTIEIQTSVTNNSLTIAVRDHGPGISPADLPHVFERLYRGSDATTHSRAGTGMGLAIARGLLAAEQGQIFADSNPDDGARFTIVVPAEVQ
jgi:two-component system sensor histidine kinase KdpD